LTTATQNHHRRAELVDVLGLAALDAQLDALRRADHDRRPFVALVGDAAEERLHRQRQRRIGLALRL
jgi:hypothetical protein